MIPLRQGRPSSVPPRWAQVLSSPDRDIFDGESTCAKKITQTFNRQAIKDFMKTELADGNASDSESLSWNMDSLLKAVAVSLAYERARAILKLQTNLRIYPHRVMREDRLENE